MRHGTWAQSQVSWRLEALPNWDMPDETGVSSFKSQVPSRMSV